MEHHKGYIYIYTYFDGSVQERRNSSALAMKLRLCCTNPSYTNPSIGAARKVVPYLIKFLFNSGECVHLNSQLSKLIFICVYWLFCNFVKMV